LRQQAVLFRTSHHADLLEMDLTVRRIPYVKYGGLAFLEAAHVKDLLALCRVAVNPRDDLAWFRILQRIDGVGPGIARRVVAALDTTDGDLAAAITGAPNSLPCCTAVGPTPPAAPSTSRVSPGWMLARCLSA
jgi:DNA helicase-2/ATP-dependent DNA helicase PcrA